MLFTELRFVPFFLITFVVAWLLRANRGRKAWLLVMSYAFYGAWDWRFLSLIIVSTGVDYVAGLKIDASDEARVRKRWLTVSLCANLGLLGVFKYFNFFITSSADLLQFLGLQANIPTLQIILPVGISFFTFQTMSYSIDIYLRNLKPTRSLLDLALFVSFFPQLVAGPIVRARTFLPQLRERPSWAIVDVKTCLMIFLIGFIKKACIADNVAPFVDVYFENPGDYTAATAWVAVTFYAVQIYCDFSGYSEMAIACAGLLGYELAVNFDSPYLARNIADFWRRWHMSLSSWLRDYLYIPLGGSRGGRLFTYRNLMLTMLLGGLWHGAAWNFVIWGGLHGGALMVHRGFRHVAGDNRFLDRLGTWLGPLVTFYWVCVAWIFFRAGSIDIMAASDAEATGEGGLATAITVLEAFVTFQSPGSQTMGANLLYVFALLAVVHVIARRRWFADWWVNLHGVGFALFYGVAAAAALMFVPVSYKPFIYFQF